MRPPIMIINFTAGGDNGGEFRHVVGRNDVRIRSTDDLGDATWTDVGQRSPMAISELKTAALNILAEYVGHAQLDPDKRPPPIGIGRGAGSKLVFTDRGLEINLGRVK